jgi:HAD superfamily hydrolase (TIGR01549 family)
MRSFSIRPLRMRGRVEGDEGRRHAAGAPGYIACMTTWPRKVDTVVLDVDGTLVDSNYHHTLAWWHAFREHGHQVPAWRIHRAIGMGGDRLVSAVADDDVEREAGDGIRDAWEKHYDAVLDQVPPLPGAQELLGTLRDRGFQVALASSGIPRHTRHAVDVLEADDAAETTTTGDDAEASKPDPELLEIALDRVDADRAVLVGDSVWDVQSGREAGIPVIGLLTGGFGRAELEDAGADVVCEDLEELRGRLDELLSPAPA